MRRRASVVSSSSVGSTSATRFCPAAVAICVAPRPPQPMTTQFSLFVGGAAETLTNGAAMVVAAYAEELLQAELCQRLHFLLDSLWTPRWRKAMNTNPRPKVARAKRSGAHPSVYRLLQAVHQDPCGGMAVA